MKIKKPVQKAGKPMIDFIQTIKTKNEPLFYFGLICIFLSLLFLTLTRFTSTQVYNVSAWYKPFKFALSIGVYAWTMALYCSYLSHFKISYFNRTVIVLLGFEIVYIALQAGRGQLSHYNLSSKTYSVLYMLMAMAATVVTLYTAYTGLLFFTNKFPALPGYYIWAIRLGILIFVVFSFEGFLMGARLSHTIGGPDGGAGIPVLNWSTKFGDPRIAHFIGMHALQALPLLSFYVLKNTKLTLLVSCLYGLLAVAVLMQALRGKPLYRAKNQAARPVPAQNEAHTNASPARGPY